MYHGELSKVAQSRTKTHRAAVGPSSRPVTSSSDRPPVRSATVAIIATVVLPTQPKSTSSTWVEQDRTERRCLRWERQWKHKAKAVP
eukprot:SAG22_NODE_5451_length_1012_cov_0.792990_2_plen_87_part_00